MGILKSIVWVYLVVLAIALIALFVLFPIVFIIIYKNENFACLFLFNLPIFFGTLFYYTERDYVSTRPKR